MLFFRTKPSIAFTTQGSRADRKKSPTGVPEAALVETFFRSKFSVKNEWIYDHKAEREGRREAANHRNFRLGTEHKHYVTLPWVAVQTHAGARGARIGHVLRETK